MPDGLTALRYSAQEQSAFLMRDFYTFAKESNVCPDIVEEPYRDVCDYLESLLPNTPKIREWRKRTGRTALRTNIQVRALYLMPRLTYKSTLVAALIIYAFLLDPDICIVVCRATSTDAEQSLAKIKTHLHSNPIITGAFRDRLEFSQWADGYITVKFRKPGMGEPTIDTTGLNMSKTGTHVDMAILDDLVHEKNYLSVTEMEKAKVKIEAFYAIVQHTGTIVVMGTRWSEIDCYGWILEQEEARVQNGKKPRWEIKLHSCWKDDEPGVPMFPTVLSVERINDLRETTRSKLFSAWYLNIARSEDEDIFTLAYMQYFKLGEFYPGPFAELEFADTSDTDDDINRGLIHKFGKRFRVCPIMLIDPAPTVTKRSDATGLVIVAFDRYHNWWVLIGQNVRKKPSARLDHIIDLAVQYSPTIVALENGDIAVPLLEAELHKNGIFAKCVSFNPLMDRRKITRDPKLAPRGETKKAAQIENLEHPLKARRVFFAVGMTLDLTNQVLKYPHLIHDDAIDAFSMTPAYETFKEARVDDDPERIFKEIEKREWELEGLEFPEPQEAGRLPWRGERARMSAIGQEGRRWHE